MDSEFNYIGAGLVAGVLGASLLYSNWDNYKIAKRYFIRASLEGRDREEIAEGPLQLRPMFWGVDNLYVFHENSMPLWKFPFGIGIQPGLALARHRFKKGKFDKTIEKLIEQEAQH